MANVSRPNLLLLAHRVPFPPDKGDRIRAFHVLKHLARNAAVHLACLADEPVDAPVVAALRRHCARVAVLRVGWRRWARAAVALARGRSVTEGAFASPTLRATIRRWHRETRFDAALASASSMVPYLLDDELKDVPWVVDLMDVDSQKWLDYAAHSRGPRAWLYRTEGRRLRRLEQTLPARAAAVVLVNGAEAELYRRFCTPGVVRAVTNGVDLDHFRPAPASAEPTCVFVGALDYFPNVEGVGWFCREVWPAVVAARPGARLQLVGRNPVPAVRRLARLPGVEVVGAVPDVQPYLAGAAVNVVPLNIARGIQNKVLEGLATARATVVSPQVLKGVEAVADVHLLTASSPGEWNTTLLRLFDDPALRQRLGDAGRRFVEANHCWETCLQPLDDLLGLSEPACRTGDQRRRATGRPLTVGRRE